VEKRRPSCGMPGVMIQAVMLWYYVSDRQERLAVPEDQLPALAGSGVVRPTTLIWQKGMAEWASAGEVKPELFQVVAEGPVGGDAVESSGLVGELARTLRVYAGWVEVSGWLHGLTGVACVTVGTAMGYFAWLKPDRLVEWGKRMPAALRPLRDYPWAVTGALAFMGLLLLFTAGQLIGGAARARRAEQLRSREELRIALRSVGSFFRSTVLTVLLGLLLLAGGLLYHYRPWQKEKVSPPAPAPLKAKERVTI
jgi:hypothetical protein